MLRQLSSFLLPQRQICCWTQVSDWLPLTEVLGSLTYMCRGTAIEESIPIEQAVNREKMRKEIINSYFRMCVCIQYSMSYISTLNNMVNIFLCTEKGIGRFKFKVHSNIKLRVFFLQMYLTYASGLKRGLYFNFFFCGCHILQVPVVQG